MKYAHIYFYLLSLTFLMLCACGDDEDSNNSLVGTWTGTLNQPDYGNLQTSLIISSIDQNSGSGTGMYSSDENDILNCDDQIFVCEPLFCNFNLTLISSNGNFYEFDQTLLGTSTCGDGTFEITQTGDNRISVEWYEESFPENRARGTLTGRNLYSSMFDRSHFLLKIAASI